MADVYFVNDCKKTQRNLYFSWKMYILCVYNTWRYYNTYIYIFIYKHYATVMTDDFYGTRHYYGTLSTPKNLTHYPTHGDVEWSYKT